MLRVDPEPFQSLLSAGKIEGLLSHLAHPSRA